MFLTSDVFYIHFDFTEEQIAAFSNPSIPVILQSCHEHCSASVPITGETRASLLRDLL